MEKETNLKYLVLTMMRKVKYIILTGVIVAIIMGAYSWINVDKNENSHNYASYAKLYLEKRVDNIIDATALYEITDDKELKKEIEAEIDEKVEEVFDSQDNTEKNISVLMSDKVLNNVAEDPDVMQEDLTVSDIREMLYLRGKENGSIVEINVVGENEEYTELICSKLVKSAEACFDENDYNVIIMQDTMSLGPVAIELRESISDPRDVNAIITQTTEAANLGKIDIIKKVILGFSAGVFLSLIYFCGVFIVRDRIVFSGQIEDVSDVKLIGNSKKQDRYWELYSNLALGNEMLSTVNFISIKRMERNQNFVNCFADTLGKAGKTVLVVECKHGNAEKGCGLSIADKKTYKYTQVHHIQLFQDSFIKDTINTLENEYDIIFFVCDGLDENPGAKLISNYTDETVILLEADTIKTKELNDAIYTFKSADIDISGVMYLQ